MSLTDKNLCSIKKSLRSTRANMRKCALEQIAELKRQAADKNNPFANCARDLLKILSMTDEEIEKVGR